MAFSEGVDQSSGLLGHFEGTVLDGEWATNPEAPNAEARERLYLYLTCSVDDILQDDYEGADVQEMTVRMSAGKGWFTEDKRYAEHPADSADKRRRFRGDSVYGKYLELLLGNANSWFQAGHKVESNDGDGDLPEVDMGNVLKELGARKANERDAQAYNGFRFEFRGTRIHYGGDFVGNSALPYTYLGVAESNSAGTGVAAGEDAPGQSPGEAGQTVGVDAEEFPEGEDSQVNTTAAASPEDNVEENLEKGLTEEDGGSSVVFSEESEEVNRVLNDLLRTSQSATEFRRQAVVIPEVRDNEAVLTKVLAIASDWPN